MEHEDYNGWRNRETWALVLHINNDQGLQAWAHDLTAELVAEHGTTTVSGAGGESAATAAEPGAPTPAMRSGAGGESVAAARRQTPRRRCRHGAGSTRRACSS